MAHKSSCRSGGLNPCWIGMMLIIGACGPSDMTQGARENAKQQSNAGAPSAPELVLGVKKEAPPPPPPAGARPTLTTPASYYEPVGPFFFYV